MSKNITILEGGETRTFGNVEKLQTNLVGGGTQNWVPEDEAGDYVDADELSVTENGYYVPDEGKFYNAVDVLVEEEPELEEITITENGTYTPQNAVGFSSVSVEVDTSGQEGDPEVHGNEVTAIAQTDINAGDTVAVQSPSDEPIGVSCPLPGKATDIPNPSVYDGKSLYWICGNFRDSELRKKPIANITSENYTVYAQKAAGDTSYYNPWIYGAWCVQFGFDSDNHPLWGSVFTNKKVPNVDGAFHDYGKYVGISGKLYDNHMRPVNDNLPSWTYGNGGYCISSARYIYRWNGAGDLSIGAPSTYCNYFTVALLGGSGDTFYVNVPSGYERNDGYYLSSGLMFCGTDKYVFLLKKGDTNTYGIFACEFTTPEEYEGTTHNIDATLLDEIDCTAYAIGHDTLYDRWAIGTNNGLVVIQSDLSLKIYPNLKAASAPFLAGQYVWLNGSCYMLIGDDAIMVATTSKGTDGQLGVCKNNVQAGETGTAIILFS